MGGGEERVEMYYVEKDVVPCKYVWCVLDVLSGVFVHGSLGGWFCETLTGARRRRKYAYGYSSFDRLAIVKIKLSAVGIESWG
jgi:hypothetical protein